MDPFARSSLPPVSHQAIHSPAVYSHNLNFASEYQDEHRRSSTVVTPPVEMGGYYLPLNATHASYNGTQPSFPVVPMPSQPSYHHPSGAVGQFQHHCPSPVSPPASQGKIHDEQELIYGQTQNMLHGYHSGDNVQPSISCESTPSSDNDAHTPEAFQPMGMPRTTSNSEVGSQDLGEPAFPPINSNSGIDSLDSPEEPRYAAAEVLSTMQDQYFGDRKRAGSKGAKFATLDLLTAPKSTKGKKPSSTKVSEKRRQQNRAAQRAMRERRKKAAQNQEVHMSTILAENVFLRGKVAQLSHQLSSMLLHDTLAPGSHHWSSTSPQASHPLMVSPPKINNNLAQGQAAAPAGAMPHSSALSFGQSHVIFPCSQTSGQVSFPSPNQGPAMSPYAPAPYDFEYLHQGPGVTGTTSLSGALEASNMSRPMTGDENAIDNYTHYGRWHDATASDGLAFGVESPMTNGPGQLQPIPGLSTDCGSIQTTSTLGSPTQTDGQVMESLPAAS